MRQSIAAVLLLLQLFASGCAVFNRENTPALNLVEQHLFPGDKGARMATYPVLIPLSLAAVTLDMVLLHPVSQIPHSWEDTRDLLWDGFEWEMMYLTESAALPLRVAVSPFIFGGSFLARSTLDISRKGGEARLVQHTRDEPEEARMEGARKASALLDEAEGALLDGRMDEVLSLLKQAEPLDPESDRFDAMLAACLLEVGELSKLSSRTDLRRGMDQPFFLGRLAAHLPGASGPDQMRLLDMLGKRRLSAEDPATAVLLGGTVKLLLVDDRVIRLKALQTLGHLGEHVLAREALRSVAGGNDLVLAAEAGRLLPTAQ